MPDTLLDEYKTEHQDVGKIIMSQAVTVSWTRIRALEA